MDFNGENEIFVGTSVTFQGMSVPRFSRFQDTKCGWYKKLRTVRICERTTSIPGCTFYVLLIIFDGRFSFSLQQLFDGCLTFANFFSLRVYYFCAERRSTLESRLVKEVCVGKFIMYDTLYGSYVLNIYEQTFHHTCIHC